MHSIELSTANAEILVEPNEPGSVAAEVYDFSMEDVGKYLGQFHAGHFGLNFIRRIHLQVQANSAENPHTK